MLLLLGGWGLLEPAVDDMPVAITEAAKDDQQAVNDGPDAEASQRGHHQ